MTAQSDLIISVRNRVGTIRLNRPKALNALTIRMIEEITQTLLAWRSDPSVDAVGFVASEGRAFCAGGDIANLYHEGKSGNHDYGRAFWQAEYQLNYLIANFPKPTVSIVNGIVMGGGVGLAAHCSFRIMTENTVLAMPECSIGLIPDIGASLLLAQAPGRCGEYIALTGARLTASDCLYAGLCDQTLNSKDVETWQDQGPNLKHLTGNGTPDASPSDLAQIRDKIDYAFSAETVEDVLARLEATKTDWSLKTASVMRANAPLSMTTTLSLIRAAREHQSLRRALQDEYRFVSRATLGASEFLEGTRAAIIDKDRQPNWSYPTMASLPLEIAQEMRRPAPGGDLVFLENGS